MAYQNANSERQIIIRVDDDLEPTYSNFAIISHSAAEIVIDFAQLMPGIRQTYIDARIVMAPANAKLFLKALRKNLKLYEARHGAVQQAEGEGNPLAGEAPDWLVEIDVDDDLAY